MERAMAKPDLPALPVAEWQDTYATLHMWTQIVGKIRLTLTPLVNHWWNVPLYVTVRGLGTSPIPHGGGDFELELDFIDHGLTLRRSDGAVRSIPLYPRSVAEFYAELMAVLRALGIQVEIHATPDEVPNPIPFALDRTHAAYDPEYAHRFWQILRWVDAVMKEFRSRFIGKCSPVHFFWGSFDLACTRFSGRRAPERPGADAVTREAYSHEVISAGFWPGGGDVTAPAFYCYAAPQLPGLEKERVRPDAASYDQKLGEFLLPYDAVRTAASPRTALLDFLQSTYEAAAKLGNWDRAALERRP